ncbi:insecticidal delta-endotoxin Cry8Ea1 family protein [Sorangium sp. So ce429]
MTEQDILVERSSDDAFCLPRLSYITFDANDYLKSVVAWGISSIPYVGGVMSLLVDLFWPSSKKSAWDEVRDNVKHMMDQATLNAINAILSGDIRQMQDKISRVSEALAKDPASAQGLYVDVARTLIGFDEKFRGFQTKDQDFAILPLYSTTVLMQVNYWTLGLDMQQAMKLTESEVNELKTSINNVVVGNGGNKESAIVYINDLYKNRLDNARNTASPDFKFNEIMFARAHGRVHGLEYVQIIQGIWRAGNTHTTTYVDVVSYAPLFGRQTPNIVTQATALDHEMGQPLTPDLRRLGIDATRRNSINKIEGFVHRVFNAPRVGGLRVTFTDGAIYVLGNITNEKKEISLGAATIVAVDVYGRGAIDQLGFWLSDGRALIFGEQSWSPHDNHKFLLEGHSIASFYLSNDASSLGGQAANFTVSYVLNEHGNAKTTLPEPI